MKTYLRALSMLAATTLLAGCASNGGNQCAGWQPIRPTASDVRVVSQQLADDVLEHNEYGAALGCWRAPR